MNRGGIYNYKRLSRTVSVLVVSADELGAAGLPIVLDITDVAPTGVRALLAVTIPGHGFALIRSISQGDPARFAEHLGTADPATMDAVGLALGAALGLGDR